MYFACGFAWQGYIGRHGHVLNLSGKGWNWIAAEPFFFRGLALDGSAASLAMHALEAKSASREELAELKELIRLLEKVRGPLAKDRIYGPKVRVSDDGEPLRTRVTTCPSRSVMT